MSIILYSKLMFSIRNWFKRYSRFGRRFDELEERTKKIERMCECIILHCADVETDDYNSIHELLKVIQSARDTTIEMQLPTPTTATTSASMSESTQH